MHKRHGLGLSQTLPSSSRPQTQLRVLADICEEERDYREADIRGTRLFVTGLPSSVDDIRLYLAFEEYGRVLEAQVAKPGLGFVVFEDMETADEALAGMEGEAISGKEIRVKRARSFYIRKEEEARLKLAQAAREREMRTAALAEEHSRRVRILEEAAYARVENQGLASHVRHFDVRGQRRAVLEEMRAEGLLDLSTPLPYQQTPHQLDSKPVRPSEERSMMDEEQHPSDGYGRYNGRSPSPQRRMPQYIDAENGHKQLRQQMEDGLRGEEEEEEEGRLFLRNLPFSTTEEDLTRYFSRFGELSEVHVCVDRVSRQPIGLAFVLFLLPSDAKKALAATDGKIFQGRLLNVIDRKSVV